MNEKQIGADQKPKSTQILQPTPIRAASYDPNLVVMLSFLASVHVQQPKVRRKINYNPEAQEFVPSFKKK